ncbi:MAG: DsbA family protein [Candidatus Gracilibacteria bacterium]
MKKNVNTLFVGMSFLIIGLVLGLLLSKEGRATVADTFNLNLSGAEDSAQGDSGAQDGASIAAQVDPSKLEEVSVSTDDDAMIGDPNAPITIVEFSDFQCPYCAKFVTESMGQLIEDYVDTGVAKLIFRDFPLPSHSTASLASQAAECVRAGATEDKDATYFEMHDLLFENQKSWSGNADAENIIIDLAVSELDADEDALRSCIDEGTMKAEVEADYTAGRSYGISGTPTFFINGKKLVGAWPYEVFVKVIDSLK